VEDKDLTIQNAGEILDSQFRYGHIVWGLGLLAAGQSATLAGTMAGQFVMEGFVKIRISRVRFIILMKGQTVTDHPLFCHGAFYSGGFDGKS